jgi:hypothetical protein
MKVIIGSMSYESSRIRNSGEPASPAQTDDPVKTRGVISLCRLELLRGCVTNSGQRSVTTSRSPASRANNGVHRKTGVE